MRFKQLELGCKCGHKLLKYKKGGSGRWIKVHQKRVIEYYDSQFKEDLTKETGTDIYCSSCGARLAQVQNLGGKFVAKINQGQITIKKA